MNAAGKTKSACARNEFHGENGDCSCEITPFDPVVFMVSVTLAGASLPVSTTVAGANTQLVVAGRPVQVKVTVPVSPPSGVMLSVELPDCPCTMVSDVGLVVKE